MKAFIIALAFGVALPAGVLAGQKDHGVVPAETLAGVRPMGPGYG
jgi:hypothetical protein